MNSFLLACYDESCMGHCTYEGIANCNSPHNMAYAAVHSNAVALLLLTCCLLLLHSCESVIVICFDVRYVMSIVVLQSS